MSSSKMLKTRLKRFRKTGEVGVFEPTPIDEIEERHHHGETVFQPAFYIPGELVTTQGALKDATDALRSMDVDFITRDVGTRNEKGEGMARLTVAAPNIPDLALEVELRVMDRKRRPSAGALAADEEQATYGNRTDEAIRIQLNSIPRRKNEAPVVGPNHCFTPTPVCGVGPADEPRPAPPPPAPRGSAGKCVRIAVIDTGIFTDVSQHPWLANDVNYSLSDIELPDGDFDGKIDPVAGHGHFVAGIIRTEAPGATIFVEKLFHRGRFIDEWELTQKLHEVLDVAPHIINLSLTGQTISGGIPTGFGQVWRRIRRTQPRIVVVASAGNAGVETPFWPAALDDVVAVGAVDENFRRPTTHPDDFSNYGPWVDVYARGIRVVNAFTTGTLKHELSPGTSTFQSPFCSWSGTSFAAPLVTGRIAARMTSTLPPLSAVVASKRVTDEARTSTIALAGVAGPQLAPDGSPIYVVR